MRRLAALLAGAALCAGAASATRADDDAADKLKSVERSIEESAANEAALARRAKALAEEAAKLRRRAVAVAARAQNHEATLNGLEDRLKALAAREAELLASFDGRRRQLAVLIAALERIARHPPVALIALPAPPEDTVRSALLLRDTVPQVEERAGALRRDLEALTELREGMAAAQRRLVTEQQALDRERTTLAALAEEKTRVAGQTEEERRAAAKRSKTLAAEAKNLRELLAKLAESRKREARKALPEAAPAASNRLAALPPAPSATPGPAVSLPAAGPIVRRFGEPGDMGQPARGVTIRTRSAAAVVAPRSGTVVFAGPFQGLGQLLIIEYGEEYHLLLAGLSRIEAAVGDRVLAGEPVGAMNASKDAEPTLYLELRRQGRPVNPLPWLAAARTRVKG